MRLSFLLLLAALPFTLPAQAVRDSAYRYAEIVGTASGGGKQKVEVNYGDTPTGRWFKAANVITDPETGKARKFASLIEALNYMSLDGWELVADYTTTGALNVEYTHLILRRREAVGAR